MTIRVEVDIFSGRSNPVIELDDEASLSLLERLRPASRLDTDGENLSPSFLGYRGFVIREAADYGAWPRRFRLHGGAVTGQGLAHYIEDRAAEHFLASSNGPLRTIDIDLERLRGAIDRAHEMMEWPWWHWHGWPWLNPCACAPIYEPTWWNVPTRQPANNCYNYATNYRSDTFAQPGKAAGAEYGALTCDAVRSAAIADDMIDSPAADNLCPSVGHLVALVIAPGWDFQVSQESRWHVVPQTGWNGGDQRR